MIYQSITELVGRTPLLCMNRYGKENESRANLIAKLEYLNPAGSAKDRVARSILVEGMENGTLTKDSVIVESTSGNTGIGLAAIAASMGIRVIITMPETMSIERRNLMKAYGAEVILTEGTKGMKGAIEKAEELVKEIPGAILAGQFINPLNPKAHFTSTGPEIWEDTAGNIDIFVAGIGTGGTITGVSKYLKGKNPQIKVVGVEPWDSPVLSEGTAGAHGIQGIGAGFVPEILDTACYDEIVKVKTQDAYEAGRKVAKSEGILVGISSGAALWAATELAKKEENAGKNIVVLLPDTGDRYLSTEMFTSVVE